MLMIIKKYFLIIFQMIKYNNSMYKYLNSGSFGSIYENGTDVIKISNKITKLGHIMNNTIDYYLINEIGILKILAENDSCLKITNIIYDPSFGFITSQYQKSLYTILCQTKTFSDKNINDIIYSVSTALAYANDHFIVHRDVKPDNIFVSNFNEPNQQIVLGDWSSAVYTQLPNINDSESVFQTLWYRAPESILGINSNNESMDIWSLGVICLEMLYGNNKNIFASKTENQQIIKQIKYFGYPNNIKMINAISKLKSININNIDHEYLNIYAFKDRSIQLLDNVNMMLKIDPSNRITASELANKKKLSYSDKLALYNDQIIFDHHIISKNKQKNKHNIIKKTPNKFLDKISEMIPNIIYKSTDSDKLTDSDKSADSEKVADSDKSTDSEKIAEFDKLRKDIFEIVYDIIDTYRVFDVKHFDYICRFIDLIYSKDHTLFLLNKPYNIVAGVFYISYVIFFEPEYEINDLIESLEINLDDAKKYAVKFIKLLDGNIIIKKLSDYVDCININSNQNHNMKKKIDIQTDYLDFVKKIIYDINYHKYQMQDIFNTYIKLKYHDQFQTDNLVETDIKQFILQFI